MQNDVPSLSNPDLLQPTRRTLISRLRDWEDKDSWQQFFDTYWRLIYSVAMKAGLSASEAEEVVQETVLSLAKKMETFEYDRERCTFKGWLMRLTRLRIQDQFRKRKPSHRQIHRETDSNIGTATVERVPDPGIPPLEQIWDKEWEQNLLEVALARVKPQVKAEHYQIFYMSALQEHPPKKVASMLGTSIAQVYLVRHRVAKLVKREKEALEDERRDRETNGISASR